jgi:hypothetical protein
MGTIVIMKRNAVQFTESPIFGETYHFNLQDRSQARNQENKKKKDEEAS